MERSTDVKFDVLGIKVKVKPQDKDTDDEEGTDFEEDTDDEEDKDDEEDTDNEEGTDYEEGTAVNTKETITDMMDAAAEDKNTARKEGTCGM